MASVKCQHTGDIVETHSMILGLNFKNGKQIITYVNFKAISLSTRNIIMMASLWCRPVFCPWTLNLPIAMVLLHLRVHYSAEIKRYKSQIRI